MATCDNKVSLNHNDEMNLKYYNKFKNVHVHKIQSKVQFILLTVGKYKELKKLSLANSIPEISGIGYHKKCCPYNFI